MLQQQQQQQQQVALVLAELGQQQLVLCRRLYLV
jgi:hypothetical protein